MQPVASTPIVRETRTGPTRPPEVPETRGERSTGQAVTVPEVVSQLCHQLTV